MVSAAAPNPAPPEQEGSASTSSPPDPFPLNCRVILHGLVKGAQYNNQIGVIRSSLPSNSTVSKNSRQQVHLVDVDKTIAVKLINLKYETRPVISLSVKEMKTVLRETHGEAGRSLTGLDKNQLAAMITENATDEEVAAILAKANAPPPPSRSAADSSSNRGAAAAGPIISKDQLQRQAEQFSSMSPEQIKSQAAMMRSMDPTTLRRMNPQMANMTDAQIKMAADQMEMMASNPGMMKMAADQMKNMSDEDVEDVRRQMAAGGGGVGNVGAAATAPLTSASPPAPSTSTTPSSAPAITRDQLQSQAEQLSSMSPEQIKSQAAMMRSMDPATLRRMNPQMANMTDAQIKMAADQMEMMANNPGMMKMAAEQMKNMNPEDVEAMQHQMHAGASPAAAGAGGASISSPQDAMAAMGDPSKLMESMDPAQIKSTLKVLKDNPEMLREMMKSNPALAGQTNSLSDEQMTKAIDMFANMDEKQIEKAMGWVTRFQRVAGPVGRGWNRLNGLAGGRLGTILLGVGVALLVGMLQRWGWIPSFAGSREIPSMDVVSEDGGAGADSLVDDQNEFA